MNDSKYLKALKYLNHATIKKLFELHDYRIDDFFVKGAARIISHTRNLKAIDSTGLLLVNDDTEEISVNIHTVRIHPSKIIDYEVIDEYVRVALIEQRVYNSTSIVLYAEINKQLL
jgi:hypothetical protein